jgi:SpoVK/Ycf46/Vps4 family AAA+-type ATPase
MGADAVAALRAALAVSPDNLPLVRHLGETLLGLGLGAEAETEYRQALAQARWSDDLALKFGLARAFESQGKATHAQLVLEELSMHREAPAAALTLYARLLLRAREAEKAVAMYKRAIAADPAAADAMLAGQLGIRAEAEPEDPHAEVVDGRVRGAIGGVEAGPSEVERPKIGFAEVGGMEAMKEEIRLKIIHPLKHPELYKAYGKTVGGGILMYGPPGCGKTHLARATAGEIKAGFIAIGINEVLDMWLGASERNLHALFEQARASTPCVLFFDEVDALAGSRADHRGGAGRQVINQFLAELDGVGASNDGVLVLAATNAPWHLDGAFRRPGRFDRILFVPPPDAPARASILRVMLKGKPIDAPDLDLVAKKTAQFSGADLKAVIDRAIEAKLAQAMQDGVPRPLGTKDLVAAAAAVRPSTREWFASAKNHALYANQGGTYDEVLKYLDRA